MPYPLLSWWIALCTISVLNGLLWVHAAVALRRRRPQLPAAVYAARRAQLALSALFVIGCAYRSVFPVHDIPRHCLVDSWLSSVLIGRTAATLAELAFALQWTLMLREMFRIHDSAVIRTAARALLPIIVLAELSSWYAVLTTANIGHVVEESLWTVAAGLVVASLVSLWPRCTAHARRGLAALAVVGLAYILFMLHVDVPMYWTRWLADEASGRPYLGLAQGAADAAQRWVVSYRWEHWKDEIAWMSLYFSVAVWLSIGLVHAPALQGICRPGDAA